VNAPESVSLRPFSAVFTTAGAWAACLGILASGVLFVLGATSRPEIYWSIVGATAATAFAWAAYRVKIEIDTNEIHVVNVRRTYRIPWASVSRIDVVAWWLSPNVIIVGNAAVRVSTQSGERVVIDASASAVARVLHLLNRFKRRDIEIEPG